MQGYELGQKRTARSTETTTPPTANTCCCSSHDGAPGRDGRDGMPGVQGPQGPPGPLGPAGRGGGGVTYIRWGSSSCPNLEGTTLVYDGLTAGTSYSSVGGAANYICMTKQPRYQPGTTLINRGQSPVSGAEYQLVRGQATDYRRIYSHNAPCAVCEVSGRSKHIMIPGTYVCPRGWTREYYGWLMSEYRSHKGRTMFICVEHYPELAPGTAADTDGVLLHHTEADCSTGLHDERKELSCVVCTK